LPPPWSKTDKRASSVLVFPVPGGPWIRARRGEELGGVELGLERGAQGRRQAREWRGLFLAAALGVVFGRSSDRRRRNQRQRLRGGRVQQQRRQRRGGRGVQGRPLAGERREVGEAGEPDFGTRTRKVGESRSGGGG
jgi:hypothetical protein